MKKSNTLFEYLYRTLEMEIKTGQLEYGAVLPSMKQISKNYDVGIRTVRDVLLQLKLDGLIQSQERVGNWVIYRNQEDEDAAKLLLSKWDAIVDITKLMVYVIPDIIQSAAQLCSPDLIAQLKQSIRKHKSDKLVNWNQACVAICSNLLTVYNNEYLMDLFLQLNRFLDVPRLQNSAETNTKIEEIMKDGVVQLIAQMETGEFSQISYTVKEMYSSIGFILNHYFEQLLKVHPEHKDFSSTVFEWQMIRGRKHRYITLARSLLHCISDGTYAPNTELPSIINLSTKYSLSSHTATQALLLLQSTGLVTAKRNRNVVTPGNAIAANLVDWHTPLTRELHTYLCSLQLLVILSRSIPTLYFDSVMRAETRNHEAFHKSKSIHTIMEEMTTGQPIHSLEHVCTQILDPMVWDFYMQNVGKSPCLDRQISFTDLYQVPDKLIAVLHESYRNIYGVVQDMLAAWGYRPAKNIPLPQ